MRFLRVCNKVLQSPDYNLRCARYKKIHKKLMESDLTPAGMMRIYNVCYRFYHTHINTEVGEYNFDFVDKTGGKLKLVSPQNQ